MCTICLSLSSYNIGYMKTEREKYTTTTMMMAKKIVNFDSKQMYENTFNASACRPSSLAKEKKNYTLK